MRFHRLTTRTFTRCRSLLNESTDFFSGLVWHLVVKKINYTSFMEHPRVRIRKQDVQFFQQFMALFNVGWLQNVTQSIHTRRNMIRWTGHTVYPQIDTVTNAHWNNLISKHINTEELVNLMSYWNYIICTTVRDTIHVPKMACQYLVYRVECNRMSKFYHWFYIQFVYARTVTQLTKQ